MNEGKNNKKLIGTIIGVIFFVILIAGATFAWLTYTANVSNGVYNTTTMNFLVNYQGGNDISSLPMLSGEVTVSQFNSAGGNVITVHAYKENLDGTLYLKLHANDTSDSDELVEAGCIRYAVFATDAIGLASSVLLSDASATGAISDANMDANRDIIIYEGPLVEYNASSPMNYFIYLWIDNELITNNVVGLTYSGYIHAFAVQSEMGNS